MTSQFMRVDILTNQSLPEAMKQSVRAAEWVCASRFCFSYSGSALRVVKCASWASDAYFHKGVKRQTSASLPGCFKCIICPTALHLHCQKDLCVPIRLSASCISPVDDGKPRLTARGQVVESEQLSLKGEASYHIEGADCKASAGVENNAGQKSTCIVVNGRCGMERE